MNPYESPQVESIEQEKCPHECKAECWLTFLAVAMLLFYGVFYVIHLFGEWRYLNAGEAVQAGDQVNLNCGHTSTDPKPRWVSQTGFVGYKTQSNDCRLFRRRR